MNDTNDFTMTKDQIIDILMTQIENLNVIIANLKFTDYQKDKKNVRYFMAEMTQAEFERLHMKVAAEPYRLNNITKQDIKD
jgi:DNA-binding transcriptional regulator WhiA